MKRLSLLGSSNAAQVQRKLPQFDENVWAMFNHETKNLPSTGLRPQPVPMPVDRACHLPVQSADGWWPQRAWSKAHFGSGIPPVRLSSPNPLLQWAYTSHQCWVFQIGSHFLTTNQWTKLHTSSSWQNTKGLTCNCSWKYGADMEGMMLWLLTLLQSGRIQLAPNRIFDRSTRDTQEEPKTKSFY